MGNPDELDAVFVPVGGGGLIAGIAAYLKALKPSIKVRGSCREAAGTATESLTASLIRHLRRASAPCHARVIDERLKHPPAPSQLTISVTYPFDSDCIFMPLAAPAARPPLHTVQPHSLTSTRSASHHCTCCFPFPSLCRPSHLLLPLDVILDYWCGA